MRIPAQLLLIALAPLARAEMMAPSSLPAARVIANIEARIRKNPADAEQRYMLGRVYYTMYCAADSRAIKLYGTEENPSFPKEHTSAWEVQRRKPNIGVEAVSNLKKALRSLKQAVMLGGGTPGLYSLTLACAYEAGIPLAPKVEGGATEATFRKQALEYYVKSFQESQATDRTKPTAQMPLTWAKWISVEAGESVLRLDPKNSLKGAIEDHKGFMLKLPSGPITPIIFCLTKSNGLADLLDPGKTVRFDLDGTGAPQRYSWVRPDTAFLVWQPDPSRKVRSGRQLFGSATWWLMPSNGYAAMSLLDDNQDGWLTRQELLGLAYWQDGNQNGVAEANEVRPLSRAGIVGFRTTFSGRIGESFVSAQGLKLLGGRVLPTYDWVTRSLP